MYAMRFGYTQKKITPAARKLKVRRPSWHRVIVSVVPRPSFDSPGGHASGRTGGHYEGTDSRDCQVR